MSQQGAIKRYLLILEKVKQSRYPSFDDIRTHMADKGFEVSRRTLQRDLDAVRYEFGIELLFSKKENGYYFDAENNQEYDLFYSFLETNMRMDLINRSIKDQKNMNQYVSLDASSQFKGFQYIDRLLDAVMKQYKVSFQHYSFEKKEFSTHIVHPYHIKEYQNRWYLIAFAEKYDSVRTFGIDRLEQVEILEATFTNNRFNADEFFRDMIGVSLIKTDPIPITIWVTHSQANYLKTLPIHHSQSLHDTEDKDYLELRLYLKPNFELIHRILGMGEAAIIRSPATFAAEIAEKINLMKKNYT